jgi:SAM-dependent methyltransferase
VTSLPAARDLTALDAEIVSIRELIADDQTLVRAVASGRRRNSTVAFRRVELRYVDLRTGRHLQITAYDDTQAHVSNVALGRRAADAVDELLSQPFANWRVETVSQTVQLRVGKRGRPLVHRTAGVDQPTPDRVHDRPKNRRLADDDDLFAALGMTTATGQIKPSRRAKFRQVQDFLGALEPLLGDLDRDRPLRMVDLGCGNAYLTFAAFAYLTKVKGVTVRALGVDVKPAARQHNLDIAERLGIAESVQFVDATIGAVDVPELPDIVLALHACDTATDDALARAVRWQAPVIVAAPCCHHDLQRQLAGHRPPDPYELVTRHGILGERLADVLTDALRAAVLRIAGYRTDVVEFVDAEHTPRNVLIRAVHTGVPPTPATVAAYQSLLASWQVQPALASRLADDFADLQPVG